MMGAFLGADTIGNKRSILRTSAIKQIVEKISQNNFKTTVWADEILRDYYMQFIFFSPPTRNFCPSKLKPSAEKLLINCTSSPLHIGRIVECLAICAKLIDLTICFVNRGNRTCRHFFMSLIDDVFVPIAMVSETLVTYRHGNQFQVMHFNRWWLLLHHLKSTRFLGKIGVSVHGAHQRLHGRLGLCDDMNLQKHEALCVQYIWISYTTLDMYIGEHIRGFDTRFKQHVRNTLTCENPESQAMKYRLCKSTYFCQWFSVSPCYWLVVPLPTRAG